MPQADLSKIERDGQIGIEVPNGAFTKNVASVTRIAVSNGGMVLSASTQNEKTGTFTLRIPAKHFDVAMLRLRALGVSPSQILYQDVTGQDVTAQFVNLQAQLSIAQGTKARLESLQANATGVGEILSLGSQIDRVQLGIEQLQGQIKLHQRPGGGVHDQGGDPREGRAGHPERHRREPTEPGLRLEPVAAGVPAGDRAP